MCARAMQRILWEGALELSRAISTALVVRAGHQSCPACAPALTCSPPACPDCVCGQGERCRVQDGRLVGFSAAVVVLVFIAGAISGAGAVV